MSTTSSSSSSSSFSSSSTSSSWRSSSSLSTSKTSRLTEIQQELKQIIQLQKLRLQATQQQITSQQLLHSDKLGITKQIHQQNKQQWQQQCTKDANRNKQHNDRKKTLQFKQNKDAQDIHSEQSASHVRITIQKQPTHVTTPSLSSSSQRLKSSVPFANIQTYNNIYNTDQHSSYDNVHTALAPTSASTFIAKDAMKDDVVSSSEWLTSQHYYSPDLIALQPYQGWQKYDRYKSNKNNPQNHTSKRNYMNENRVNTTNKLLIKDNQRHYNYHKAHNLRSWQSEQRNKHLLQQKQQQQQQQKAMRLRQDELQKLYMQIQQINQHKASPLTTMSTSQLKKAVDYLWLTRSQKMKHKLKRNALLHKAKKQTRSLAAPLHADRQHKHDNDDDYDVDKQNTNEKKMRDNRNYLFDKQGLNLNAIHNVAAITLNKPLKAVNANTYHNNAHNSKHELSDNRKGKAVVDSNAGELYYYYNKGFRLLQYV